MFENSRSTERAAGREHIPIYPKGFIAIRTIQLVIAVIILGLIAYSLSLIIFDGNSLNIFTAIATIIISIYYIVAEFGAPKLYNYWAAMSLDIFMVIFWITSFALLASEVAPYMKGYCDYYYCYSLSGTDLVVASCLAAAAGLGGLEFVLFSISLIIHSIMMHRHRKAGLHCNPIGSGAAAGVAPSSMPASSVQQPVQAEKPHVMPSYTAVPQQQQQQPQGVPPQVYMQQQQGYPQQTMTPPPQQPYGAPMAQPTPYYPQQTPSPLVAQQTGPYAAPPQQGVPAPHPGHYEAQGTQVPQQYQQ